MKKRMRILALLMAIALFCTALAACTGPQNLQTNPTTKPNATDGTDGTGTTPPPLCPTPPTRTVRFIR